MFNINFVKIEKEKQMVNVKKYYLNIKRFGRLFPIYFTALIVI